MATKKAIKMRRLIEGKENVVNLIMWNHSNMTWLILYYIFLRSRIFISSFLKKKSWTLSIISDVTSFDVFLYFRSWLLNFFFVVFFLNMKNVSLGSLEVISLMWKITHCLFQLDDLRGTHHAWMWYDWGDFLSNYELVFFKRSRRNQQQQSILININSLRFSLLIIAICSELLID